MNTQEKLRAARAAADAAYGPVEKLEAEIEISYPMETTQKIDWANRYLAACQVLKAAEEAEEKANQEACVELNNLLDSSGLPK